jgi:hypothetical protein
MEMEQALVQTGMEVEPGMAMAPAWELGLQARAMVPEILATLLGMRNQAAECQTR